MARPRKSSPTPKSAQSYQHPDSDLPARPEIGAQAHFKQAKPSTKYQFDSSLAPALEWDGQNPSRERAEALIRDIAESGLKIAELSKKEATKERDRQIEKLRAKIRDGESALRKISGPFLNWSGKAERLSFDVPTLPLFIHERLSTSAILDTLKGHKRDKQDTFLDTLFGSEERPLADQVLRAYEYRDNWVNRLILGDSLVVMNSLLRYESLGGQVQMIYIDPPYGVKFGSNFQPFVRKRDVSHNDDDDMTREPEMVQAYRDTWELGLHSYLTYLRDRLFLARELLAPSGSVFVQISDENLHHVREVMEEVFGAENFVGQIPFVTTTSQTSDDIGSVADYLLWFAKDHERIKYNQLYLAKDPRATGGWGFNYIEEMDGTRRPLTREERRGEAAIPPGKIYRLDNLTSQGTTPTGTIEFEFNGKRFHPGQRNHWKTTIGGMHSLVKSRRIQESTNQIQYVRFFDDFPVQPISNLWTDTTQAGFVDAKLYVVQTLAKVVERCLLMTTSPGDLVLDPTCGSGTTAHVAEQWGRRWITCDTSRVPLALARQRLLTATYDYYQLKDEKHGPAGGFVYLPEPKSNNPRAIGPGIVPHITLGSIANCEPPAQEVLVDRPEVERSVVRVTGPFTFEATIPTSQGLDGKTETPTVQAEEQEKYVQRMLEVLRRAPVLRLPANQTVTLKGIRPPAKTLTLDAEALVDKPTLANLADDASKQPSLTRDSDPVAIVFGPENGPLTERLVREAWDEAGLKHYTHLYVIGFAIDPKARQFIDTAGKIGVACTYLQATMDLQMGDLLKNMRSSQIFSVCGLPDVKINRRKPDKTIKKDVGEQWDVELRGLDTFDPITMDADHLKPGDVPAWLLDTDYNGMVFRVRQAFFPRTGAWENLKKSLKMEFEDTVWDHLAGTTSAPFPAGEHKQIAVKVIDPRGNELLVVKKLEETK